MYSGGRYVCRGAVSFALYSVTHKDTLYSVTHKDTLYSVTLTALRKTTDDTVP